ncbi:MAG: Abi-alpha family protein, partial [Desulfobacteraceae bacterium]|nr:Abi-alpha family protein [Desulfobacteraceae bacterium]
EFPHLTPTYIDNLCRLGLSEVPVMGSYTGKGAYDSLESDPMVKAIITDIEKNEKIKTTIERKYLRITELGKLFAKICVVRKP